MFALARTNTPPRPPALLLLLPSLLSALFRRFISLFSFAALVCITEQENPMPHGVACVRVCLVPICLAMLCLANGCVVSCFRHVLALGSYMYNFNKPRCFFLGGTPCWLNAFTWKCIYPLNLPWHWHRVSFCSCSVEQMGGKSLKVHFCWQNINTHLSLTLDQRRLREPQICISIHCDSHIALWLYLQGLLQVHQGCLAE